MGERGEVKRCSEVFRIGVYVCSCSWMGQLQIRGGRFVMVVEPLLGPGVATSLFSGHDGLGTDGGKHHRQTAAFSTDDDDDDGSSDVVAIVSKIGLDVEVSWVCLSACPSGRSSMSIVQVQVRVRVGPRKTNNQCVQCEREGEREDNE